MVQATHKQTVQRSLNAIQRTYTAQRIGFEAERLLDGVSGLEIIFNNSLMRVRGNDDE